MELKPMKGITCCGDCGYYNWKKHKCTRATDEGDARDNFYADCPLPDVVLPAVDAVPVVQRWTSVKDKQPPVAGWYLVFYNGSDMDVAFFKGKTWPFDNHYHTITHWMPLPEPPKMGDGVNG